MNNNMQAILILNSIQSLRDNYTIFVPDSVRKQFGTAEGVDKLLDFNVGKEVDVEQANNLKNVVI